MNGGFVSGLRPTKIRESADYTLLAVSRCALDERNG